jgi:hypothetical protein
LGKGILTFKNFHRVRVQKITINVFARWVEYGYLQASYTPFWGKKMHACNFIYLKIKRNYTFWNCFCFFWGKDQLQGIFMVAVPKKGQKTP